MRSAWTVVAGTFVSQMFVIGFFTYSVSILIPLIRADFGVSLEQVMYSLAAGTFLSMFMLPLAGVLLDRYSPRWIMSGGILAFALGLWLLSGTSSITQYIAVFAVIMSMGNAFAGSMASQTVVSRRFTLTRGRALGVSSIGTSVGGIALPALLAFWIPDLGWRLTLQNLSLILALGVFPNVLLTVSGEPDKPKLAGQDTPASVDSSSHSALTLGEIIRTPSYWYIGIALGLMFSAYSSTLSNLIAYATSLDISAAQSSNLIMVVAGMGILGKLLFGFAADKINLKLGLWAAMALVIIGLVMLAFEPSYRLIFAASILLGLAAGGMLPIWGAMMAQTFGLLSYGRAMGLMGPLITMLVIPGYAITGRLFDATGSYQTGMTVFSVTVFVAALLLIPLKISPVEAKLAGVAN